MKSIVWLLLVSFLFGSLTSALIPPLPSPDEQYSPSRSSSSFSATSDSSSSSSVFTLGIGAPTLLSGALTACDTVNSSTCKGGLASFLAYGRNLTNHTGVNDGTDVLFMLPQLDVSTPFVQMHPNGLSVNLDVYRAAGISHYVAYPSFFTQNIDYTRFYNAVDITPIVTNILVPVGNRWRGRLQYYAPSTLPNGMIVCVTRTVQMEQTWVVDAVASLSATLEDMKQSCDITIVTAGDLNFPASRLLPLLGATLPDVFIDNSLTTTAPELDTYTSLANGTLRTVLTGGISVTAPGTFISFDINGTSRKVTSARVISPDMEALPNSLKDAAYYELQALLRDNALLASTNDPILATAVQGAAKSRVDNSYPCFAGECAQATLYTAAYRWRYETDIGLTNSGGVRGPGWAAGQDLRTSDVWALMPFTNYPCTGKMLGLKVWELINNSMHYCTFSDAYSSTASAFLQLAGVEIDYDKSAWSVAKKTRVRAIRIFDRAEGVFKPLERLKYYTFATDAYQCSFADASKFLQPKYEGETMDAAVGDELIQTSIQEYLKAHNPYSPSIVGYLQNVAVNMNSDDMDKSFMVWTQKTTDCTSRQRWAPTFGTCLDCDGGMQRDSNDATRCVVIPSSSSDSNNGQQTLVQIIVPIVSVMFVVLLLLIGIVYWRSSGNIRNTKFAPKGDSATIIFTDIQMSTKLWGAVPASMGVALDQHHAMIRDCIRQYGGYEVKTVGDSFMIAVATPRDAIDLALQIQLDFHAAEWPSCINQVYIAESYPELLEMIEDNPDDLSNEGMERPLTIRVSKSNTPGADDIFSASDAEKNNSERNATCPSVSKYFNGIRVRIGIHHGPVEVIFDEIAKGYDYYGNTVNIAARIESVGDGGQIVISRDVANKISPDDSKFRLELLGVVHLKGVSCPTELLQVTPVALDGRTFTPKVMANISANRGTSAVAGLTLDEATNIHQAKDDSDRISTSSHASVVKSRGGQVGPDGAPILSDKESLIRDILIHCFKPLNLNARKSQIEIISKSWRVRLPTSNAFRSLNEEGKNGVALSVIAQRIGSVKHIGLRVDDNFLHTGARRTSGGSGNSVALRDITNQNMLAGHSFAMTHNPLTLVPVSEIRASSGEFQPNEPAPNPMS